MIISLYWPLNLGDMKTIDAYLWDHIVTAAWHLPCQLPLLRAYFPDQIHAVICPCCGLTLCCYQSLVPDLSCQTCCSAYPTQEGMWRCISERTDTAGLLWAIWATKVSLLLAVAAGTRSAERGDGIQPVPAWPTALAQHTQGTNSSSLCGPYAVASHQQTWPGTSKSQTLVLRQETEGCGIDQLQQKHLRSIH